MTQYLVFQLYAPLASWGVEAVGEVRHTAAVPGRSALLGLLGAALGIKREEEARLNAFNQHYYFAVCPRSTQEAWLRDYHTVSMPRENKKRRYFTRRDELLLAPDEVGTIVTQREYRSDGYYQVAVRATGQAPYSLAALQSALEKPHFPLYMGRKACPLALPLAPYIATGTLVEVMRQAEQRFSADDNSGLNAILDSCAECYWDDPDESSIPVREQRWCGDRPVSRQRWQFAERLCFVGTLPREGG